MAPHYSTVAWKIPWMEEPGRLQSMGSLKVRHDWATSLSLFTFIKRLLSSSSLSAIRVVPNVCVQIIFLSCSYPLSQEWELWHLEEEKVCVAWTWWSEREFTLRWFNSCVNCRLAPSLSPGHLLKMQIHGPHSRFTESDTPEWSPTIRILPDPPDGSGANSGLRKIAVSCFPCCCC